MGSDGAPVAVTAPPSGSGVAGRFSWGAFLLPEFWYLIHRLWWRAAYFWLIRIAAIPWYLLMSGINGDGSIAPTVVLYLVYYGSSFVCARNARLRAREASCLYDDDAFLAHSERLWLIAGLVLTGLSAVSLLW